METLTPAPAKPTAAAPSDVVVSRVGASRRNRFVTAAAVLLLPLAMGDGAAAALADGVAWTYDGITGQTTTQTLELPPELPALPDTRAFARVAGLQLDVPAARHALVGFHQASSGIALEMTPVGDSLADIEEGGPSAHESSEGALMQHRIMPWRARGTSATSAVDIAIPQGVEITAPVAGTITHVEPYLLYGRHDDTRVEIKPDENPDVTVTMIHMRGVAVRVGQTVERGERIAAEAAMFNFASQVDRYFPDGPLGHVHVEVKPAGAASDNEA